MRNKKNNMEDGVGAIILNIIKGVVLFLLLVIYVITAFGEMILRFINKALQSILNLEQ